MLTPGQPEFIRARLAVLVAVGATVALLVGGAAHAATCTGNAIVCENQQPGVDPSVWDLNNADGGDPSIQGFATDISVNKGGTVNFKVNLTKTGVSYKIDIYRLGYYQGNGARFMAELGPFVGTTQPTCPTDSNTGLVDCGNWSVSASWQVPSDAVSGVYIAKLVRLDTFGSSHMVFIVRDDASRSDLLFQTSDETWQAYNRSGGNTGLQNSLYNGSHVAVGNPTNRAYKVSYNRPFTTRAYEPASWLLGPEFSMIRFLERNGYDLNYTTGVDGARFGSLIQQHKVFLSVGHDEYWSGQQRANVEAARAAGVNLAFFSGNEMFWKTRWENAIDGSGQSYRTLVCYKESTAFRKLDPTSTFTGNWRDVSLQEAIDTGDPVTPENALTGQLYETSFRNDPIIVPARDAKLRFWRNTSVANLTGNQTATLPAGVLGYEWDVDADNAYRPAGEFDMSSTTESVTTVFDTGQSGTITHSLSEYRAASGALVFGAGTIQWAYGLDGTHDNTTGTTVATNTNMQQATVNVLADMSAQPGSLDGGLAAASPSVDTLPPSSTVTSPGAGTTLSEGQTVTVTGTASDAGGGVVAGVEVSTDSGHTWHEASGTTSWSYTFRVPLTGAYTFLSRAVDDSGNLERPTNVACPCSIWKSAVAPATPSSGDGNPIEVGTKFRSDVAGTVNGVRFYKGTGNTGTHVGHLWSATGTLLATATFTGETASGWQQATFTPQIQINANTTYVISYYAPNGNYSFDRPYFNSGGVDDWPLHALADGVDGANGVYLQSASGYPTQTYLASNYWVDVVFASGPPDTTPPTAPSGLTATGSVNGQVSLSWGASTDNVGVTRYGVYRSTTSGFIPSASNRIAYAAGTSYTDTGLAVGTYYYVVEAEDAVGNASAPSNQATGVVPSDTTPPTAPANLVATGGAAVAALTWNASTDDVGVVRYDVYRSTTSGFTPSPSNRIAQPTGTSYTDSSLAAGTYYYLVQAEDAAGNLSASSNPASAVVTPPPSGLVAAYSFNEGTGSTVTDASGNNNTGTLTNTTTWAANGKYGSALSFNGSSSWVAVANSSSLQLTNRMTLEAWVNPSTLNGAWRTVIMKQQTGAGVDYSLYADTDRHAPVTQLYTNGENNDYGTAALSTNTWSHLAATWDGTTLRLYVNGTLASSLAVSGTLLSSTGVLRIGGNSVYGEYFSGLIDDVRIYNRALSQAEVQNDMQTPVGGAPPPPDTTPPTAPTNLTASGSLGQASLSWTASTDNVGVTRYDVYRSTTSGFTPSASNRIAQPTGTSYTDTGLAAGTYYYVVQAEDAAGNISASSNQAGATVTGDTTPPTAPTNLVATGGAGSAGLTWGASTDNIGVTRYDVYRSTTSGFTPSVSNRIAQPTGTSYTDSNLAAGTYYYLVRAEDAAGNLSASSNQATATVTAPPSGLVAAYSFNDGTGTTVADSSGSGNTGTLSNTTWTANGKYGKALSFDGASSWVTVANSPSLQLTNRMTLEAWVNPDTLNGAWRCVIIKQQTGAGVDYSLYADTDQHAPATQLYTTGENDDYGTAVLPTNNWTYLAATWDGTTLRLYVNGTLASSLAVSGTLLSSTGVLRIGGNSVWGEFFSGMIDEVRIYNRALSQTEIQTDMQTPIP